MEFDRITLAHGGGGLMSERLLRDVIFPVLGIPNRAMDDSAILDGFNGRSLAFSTDSFVVQPLEFPGGDIGRLAVCGTVNDLATSGADPLVASLGLVIEEGLEIEKLKAICQSIATTCAEGGISIVCGDTKVIERGKGSGILINTSGIGVLSRPALRLANAQVGDVIILSGTIGDHGAAIVAARNEYAIQTRIESDVAPLNGMVARLLDDVPEIHVLKDPTRGGVAMALHEIAQASGAGIEIEERSLRIKSQVRALCDLLGFDPLEMANEGKMLVLCTECHADQALASLRKHPYGKEAAVIGRVVDTGRSAVVMKTELGGRRVAGIPTGELLPRIC